jgi:hypothetical protein
MSTNAVRRFSSAAPTEPLGDLLRRVADELRNAARAVDDIYGAADEAEAVASNPQHRPLTQALQELDHTYQKLFCLADFLNGLAQSAPAQWALDPNPAANGVTLSALAERLRSPEPLEKRSDDLDGEFELF